MLLGSSPASFLTDKDTLVSGRGDPVGLWSIMTVIAAEGGLVVKIKINSESEREPIEQIYYLGSILIESS